MSLLAGRAAAPLPSLPALPSSRSRDDGPRLMDARWRGEGVARGDAPSGSPAAPARDASGADLARSDDALPTRCTAGDSRLGAAGGRRAEGEGPGPRYPPAASTSLCTSSTVAMLMGVAEAGLLLLPFELLATEKRLSE